MKQFLQIMFIFISTSAFSEVGSIDVAGWPMSDLSDEKPSLRLGADPVFGRLVCPALIQLNLKAQKFDQVILRGLTSSEVDGKRRWDFHLRKGIYWWDQKEVSSEDLSSFLELNLRDMLKAKTAGVWDIPSFTMERKGQIVSVVWDKNPRFGPYILSGIPLWRKKKDNGFKYQCAGIYKVKRIVGGFSLLPSKRYGKHRKRINFITKSPLQRKISGLRFAMGSDFKSSPDKRAPNKPISCQRMVDLPYLSVINWNPSGPLSKDRKLRYLFTEATPRGSILRAGNGFLGRLISAPIPRNHPGYDSRIKVRPFSLERVSAELNRLGYKRPEASMLRVDKNKKEMKLKLYKFPSQTSLLDKVLSDAFLFLGIEMDFVYKRVNSDSLDGSLVDVSIPWPELDYLPQYHGKVASKLPFFSIGDPKLDKILEGYALSLSFGKPDFSLLKKIHKNMFQSELVTVLLQHATCLRTEGRYANKVLKKIDVRDPNWFKSIILNNF